MFRSLQAPAGHCRLEMLIRTMDRARFSELFHARLYFIEGVKCASPRNRCGQTSSLRRAVPRIVHSRPVIWPGACLAAAFFHPPLCGRARAPVHIYIYIRGAGKLRRQRLRQLPELPDFRRGEFKARRASIPINILPRELSFRRAPPAALRGSSRSNLGRFAIGFANASVLLPKIQILERRGEVVGVESRIAVMGVEGARKLVRGVRNARRVVQLAGVCARRFIDILRAPGRGSLRSGISITELLARSLALSLAGPRRRRSTPARIDIPRLASELLTGARERAGVNCAPALLFLFLIVRETLAAGCI